MIWIPGSDPGYFERGESAKAASPRAEDAIDRHYPEGHPKHLVLKGKKPSPAVLSFISNWRKEHPEMPKEEGFEIIDSALVESATME